MQCIILEGTIVLLKQHAQPDDTVTGYRWDDDAQLIEVHGTIDVILGEVAETWDLEEMLT